MTTLGCWFCTPALFRVPFIKVSVSVARPITCSQNALCCPTKSATTFLGSKNLFFFFQVTENNPLRDCFTSYDGMLLLL